MSVQTSQILTLTCNCHGTQVVAVVVQGALEIQKRIHGDTHIFRMGLDMLQRLVVELQPTTK